MAEKGVVLLCRNDAAGLNGFPFTGRVGRTYQAALVNRPR